MREEEERAAAQRRSMADATAAVAAAASGKQPVTVDQDAATPSMVSESSSESRTRACSTSAVPRRLDGRYCVRKILGQGGMGTVFEAHDEQLDRPVAVKLLLPRVAARHTARLRREAEALAKLSHPNVVQVFDVGEVNDQVFVVMELVRGQTLWQWQRLRRRSWRECVQVYAQAGRGLAAAHARGLVHRDFKPGNCIIGASGRVRVLDFGLARQLGPLDREVPSAPPAEQLDRTETSGERLTRTGTVLGTVAYMPLEQLRGDSVDARSDQFSFCVSLYQALYGRRPFEATTALEQLEVLARDEPTPAEGRGVPPELWRVLRRGLARDPAERWPSMDAMVDALEALLRPLRRRMLGLGVLGLGLAGGLGVWAAAPTEPEPCEQVEQQLVGVWDNEARARVAASLRGAVDGQGAQVWEPVERALDEYAERWVGAYSEACAETYVYEQRTESTFDVRVQCLNERSAELRSVVDVLSNADAEIKQNASRATKRALLDIDRCADPEYIEAQAPLPADPEVAAQVEAMMEDLARARAFVGAGQYQRSLDITEDILARLAETPHGPLEAEATYYKGQNQERLQRHQEAVETLERAFFLAGTWKRWETQAAAINRLIYTHTNELRNPEVGLEWVRHGEALFERTGVGSDHLMLGNFAQVHMALGDHEAAIDALGRSLAIVERLPDERYQLATTLNNLGLAYGKLHDYERARESFERSLAIKTEDRGARHPYLLSTLTNLCDLHRRRRQYDQAEHYLQWALSVCEESFGPRHVQVARVLDLMGVVENGRGRPSLAVERLEEALAIAEGGSGLPLLMASIHTNLGIAYNDLGQYDAALESHRRAQSIAEETAGADSAMFAITLQNMGIVHNAQGRYEQAVDSYQRALSIQRDAAGPRSKAVAELLLNIGNVYREQGRTSEALEHYRWALSIQQEVYGVDDPALVDALYSLGQILMSTGEVAESLEHTERALSLCEQHGLPLEMRGAARFLRARALLAAGGQRIVALALAELARDELDAAQAEHSDELGEIDRWLEGTRRDELRARARRR